MTKTTEELQQIGERMVELEQSIELKEILWRAVLVSTDLVINDLEEVIKQIQILIDSLTDDGHKMELSLYLHKYKKKLTKYRKALKDEKEMDDNGFSCPECKSTRVMALSWNLLDGSDVKIECTNCGYIGKV